MSRRADVTLACWDGEHTFRLRIGELITLQERTDAGPAFLINRLTDGSWRVNDVRETLRLGLIGAGVAQADALKLIVQHVDCVPLLDNVDTALSVLMAAVIGVKDERLGEGLAGETAKDFPAASSTSPASTAPEPSSG